MAQTLRQQETQANGRCVGPLEDKLLTMRLFQGQTLRWRICPVGGDKFPVTQFDPATNEIFLGEPTCIGDGDCIYLKGHEGQCEEWLLNGEHIVESVNGDGSKLAITQEMMFELPQGFSALPQVPGCDDSQVSPPTVSRIRKRNLTWCGTITNRYPSEDTRLALAATTTQGSNIVCLSETGQVFEGDVVCIPAAGINDARAKRIWREHGQDWVELSQFANRTGCSAMSTEVGVLATFTFRKSGCCCVVATLSSDDIRALPLIGDKVMPRRNEDCGPYYKIGVFSITASFLNDCLEEESELVAHGCVELYPTTKKTIPCL